MNFSSSSKSSMVLETVSICMSVHVGRSRDVRKKIQGTHVNYLLGYELTKGCKEGVARRSEDVSETAEDFLETTEDLSETPRDWVP